MIGPARVARQGEDCDRAPHSDPARGPSGLPAPYATRAPAARGVAADRVQPRPTARRVARARPQHETGLRREAAERGPLGLRLARPARSRGDPPSDGGRLRRYRAGYIGQRGVQRHRRRAAARRHHDLVAARLRLRAGRHQAFARDQAGTILQLCTYAELLQPMQGVAPDHVHVITPLEQETYRTAKFAAYYRLVRARLQAAVTATPPPSTYPHPVAHCDICIYWRHCDRQRRADDHPSLIAAIRSAQVREFQQQGLPTVAAIAQREGRLPAKPTRGAADTYRRLGQQARLQVASRGADMPQTRGPRARTRPWPGTAAGAFGRRHLPRLRGRPIRRPARAGVPHRRMHQERERRASNSPSIGRCDAGEEKAALEAFIDFALARVQQHPGTHVYHFGAYEPAALKRLAARHATRGCRARSTAARPAFRRPACRRARGAFASAWSAMASRSWKRCTASSAGWTCATPAVARRDLELALELGDADAIADETP